MKPVEIHSDDNPIVRDLPHSIRSNIHFLFDGLLPVFSIGTNNATACAPQIQHAVEEICMKPNGYTSVTNGRFKGGWTTRQYGKPDQYIQAIQMEPAQATYLAGETSPFEYDQKGAEKLRKTL